MLSWKSWSTWNKKEKTKYLSKVIMRIWWLNIYFFNSGYLSLFCWLFSFVFSIFSLFSLVVFCCWCSYFFSFFFTFYFSSLIYFLIIIIFKIIVTILVGAKLQSPRFTNFGEFKTSRSIYEVPHWWNYKNMFNNLIAFMKLT